MLTGIILNWSKVLSSMVEEKSTFGIVWDGMVLGELVKLKEYLLKSSMWIF